MHACTYIILRTVFIISHQFLDLMADDNLQLRPCLVRPTLRRLKHCSDTVATVLFSFYLVIIVQSLTN